IDNEIHHAGTRAVQKGMPPVQNAGPIAGHHIDTGIGIDEKPRWMPRKLPDRYNQFLLSRLLQQVEFIPHRAIASVETSATAGDHSEVWKQPSRVSVTIWIRRIRIGIPSLLPDRVRRKPAPLVWHLLPVWRVE